MDTSQKEQPAKPEEEQPAKRVKTNDSLTLSKEVILETTEKNNEGMIKIIYNNIVKLIFIN